MRASKIYIDGIIIFEPEIYKDERGLFFESFNYKFYDKFIKSHFVQDNHSISKKGVVRGLHFQTPPYSQAKLVRCVSGAVLDVVVDLRKKSKTYGKFFSIKLSSENFKQIFIPKGFAHGFQSLCDNVILNYKVDNYYNSKFDSGILWNDSDLLIDWDYKIDPILSKKDLELISFKNLKSPF